MEDLVARVARVCKSLMGRAEIDTAARCPSCRSAPLAAVTEHAGLAPEGMAREDGENPVSGVQVRFSPIMALFAHSPSESVTLPLEPGQPCTLEQLLRQLEQQAPEAVLRPGTGRLRPHVRVYLNRQAVVNLDRQVRAGDVIELEMQAVGGG